MPRKDPEMSTGKEIFFKRPKRLKRSQTLFLTADSINSFVELNLIPSFSKSFR